MKRIWMVTLLGFAFLGVPTAAVANAIEGCTTWFEETADTFEANASGRWTYAPGVAKRAEGEIRVLSNLSAADARESELRYAPEKLPESTGRQVIVENRMHFDAGADLSAEAQGGYAGIAVAVTNEGSAYIPDYKYYFAVLDPLADGAWRRLDVAAMTNVFYDVRVTLDYSPGAKSATYVYKLPSESTFTELVKVDLPETASEPSEVAFSGAGGVKTFDAGYFETEEDPYARFAYARDAIVTWVDQGNSPKAANTNATAVDTFNSRNWTAFHSFVRATGGAWADDPTKAWAGNVKYTNIPRCTGTASMYFWSAFQRGRTAATELAYTAPGLVIRFRPNAAGEYIYGGVAFTKNNIFNVGGLIVEKGAAGHSISYGSSSKYSTEFGDPRGTVETHYVFHEDFFIKRGYKTGSETRFFGTLAFDIDAGKTFSVNTFNNSYKGVPFVLDPDTSAHLKLCGEGTLAFSTLTATGPVIIDASAQDAARTTPYLDGALVVDGETGWGFPAGFAEGTPYRFSTGAINHSAALVTNVVPVIIGDEKTVAAVTYAEESAQSVVRYSRDISPFSDRTIRIPSGFTVTVTGTDDPYAPLVWPGKWQNEGTLVVRGYVTFSGGVTGSGSIVHADSVYQRWAANPAVFTWAGESGDFAMGSFARFDPETCSDLDETYHAADAYATIPGQGGRNIERFRWIFTASDAAATPAFIAPGYALRFARGTGFAGAIDVATTSLDLGGLIVESGATGVSLESSGATRATSFGDPTARTNACLDVQEDFTVNRSGPVTLKGTLDIAVAEGRTFDLNSAQTAAVTLDPASCGVLKLNGAGTVKVRELTATGAVTLDFSRQDPARATPVLDGALKVDASTRYAFPGDAADESGSYVLCSGTLTAPTETVTGLVTVGGVTRFAKLTFDAASRTVSWKALGEGECNYVKISKNWSWSSLPWSKAYDSALPTVLDFETDARVALEGNTAVTISSLLVTGGHAAILSYARTPKVGSLAVADGTTLEIAIPYTTDWATSAAFTVPRGMRYLLEGGTSENSRRIWAGALDVLGSVRTTGYILLTSSENVFGNGASLTVSSGRLQLSGAAGGLSGHVTVSQGAVLTSATTGLLATDRPLVLDILGTNDLARTRWTLSQNATVNVYAGGAILGTGPENDCAIDLAGAAALNGRATGTPGTATVSTRLRYRTDVDGEAETDVALEEGVTLALTDANPVNADSGYRLNLSGAGSLFVAEGATVPLGCATFPEGGVRGAGTVIFTGDPSSTGAAASFADGDLWQGLVWFKGVALGGLGFDPDTWGSAKSRVRLTGCSGYFRRALGPTKATLELTAGDSGETAFLVRGGYEGDYPEVTHLTGDGSLVAQKNSDTGAYGLCLPDVSGFTGSLALEGEGNTSQILVGTAREGADVESENAGRIVLAERKTATVGADASWSAPQGVVVGAGSTLALVNGGALASAVRGTGTVSYRGLCDATKPDTAAKFTDSSAWSGVVRFDGATLTGCALDRGGHAFSTLVVSNSTGRLDGLNVTLPVTLEGEGLRITEGGDGQSTTFEEFLGDGAFTLDYSGSRATWRLLDLSGYTGALGITEGAAASILLGRETSYVRDRTIVFPDDYTLKTGLGWSSPRVDFGAALNVTGAAGEEIMKVLGDDSRVSGVAVNLSEAEEGFRYQLMLDGDTHALYVDKAQTAPKMTIASAELVYGTDLTNAEVVVTISDWFDGYGYAESTVKAVIRDASGRAVGAAGGIVDGNGEFSLGTVALPDGPGGDYTCELVAEVSRSDYDDPEPVDERKVADSVTHDVGGTWIRENAATFPTGVSGKTGEWTWEADSKAWVEDEAIHFGTNYDASVLFTPYTQSSNDVTTIDMALMSDGSVDLGDLRPGDAAKAAVAIARLGSESSATNCFALWNPETKAFEAGFGSGSRTFAQAGHRYAIRIAINRTTGTVSYTADGDVLTNAEGRAFFNLRPDQLGEKMVSRVRFLGLGSVKTLDGTCRDSALASVEGARYASVDEAVEAAKASGAERVGVLWDATWRPLTNDVGRTFNFDLNGYVLTVDPGATNGFARTGYQLVDHGDGTYSVDAVTYYLTFLANGGTGEMERQGYSVTNLVFNLATNCFALAGKDFAFWNDAEDGSGANSWTNHALVDMGPFGLTNLSLYAQWTVARRTVTVAAADESVYIELVMTNSVKHQGVRFHTDRTAAFDVYEGADVVIRFSTDIGRALAFDRIEKQNVSGPVDITSDLLPKPTALGAPLAAALSPRAYWAATRGISSEKLAASRYVTASAALGASKLLDDGATEIRISEFAVTEEGCRFRVSIDARPVTDATAVADMVRVSDDLQSWRGADSVSVDGDTVTVGVTQGQFLKLVVPKD